MHHSIVQHPVDLGLHLNRSATRWGIYGLNRHQTWRSLQLQACCKPCHTRKHKTPK